MAIQGEYEFFLIGLFILTIFISYSTLATARLLKRWQPPDNPLLDRVDVILRFFLTALCIVLGLVSGLDAATLGWTFQQPLRQALVGVGIGVTLALVLFGLSRQADKKGRERFVSQRFIEMILPRSRAEAYRIALALGPVVVLEELLFRSLLIGGLSPLFPAPLLIVLVSVLFGVLHAPQGLWGMVGAGAAGLIFGALFLAEQSLMAPVVAHYVANLVQIVLAMRLRAKRKADQLAGISSTVD
ncbi:MAG: CPBP family glutamic-type intramembrane protease [Caldilinea sp.]|nr:CPBP family glutamic-type intramembrane protease [Caldilinea sp.]MDW8442207.1 CPBP family intramembrane glutamic endopeptidase [Caldilineaceae bacterium]